MLARHSQLKWPVAENALSGTPDLVSITSTTDRRAHILASALAVFTHKGYHNTSMDDVAARAEISKPIVYQHFAGKRELYLGLLDDSVDTVTDGVRSEEHTSELQSH